MLYIVNLYTKYLTKIVIMGIRWSIGQVCRMAVCPYICQPSVECFFYGLLAGVHLNFFQIFRLVASTWPSVESSWITIWGSFERPRDSPRIWRLPVQGALVRVGRRAGDLRTNSFRSLCRFERIVESPHCRRQRQNGNKIYFLNIQWGSKCSIHLNTRIVRYPNAWFFSGCPMVRYSNGGLFRTYPFG